MEEEKKAFLWMGFQRKILTSNNRTKDKATVINQIEWRERGKRRGWQKYGLLERESVFLNIASESVFKSKPKYKTNVRIPCPCALWF
jgi:hypothetical protein